MTKKEKRKKLNQKPESHTRIINHWVAKSSENKNWKKQWTSVRLEHLLCLVFSVEQEVKERERERDRQWTGVTSRNEFIIESRRIINNKREIKNKIYKKNIAFVCVLSVTHTLSLTHKSQVWQNKKSKRSRQTDVFWLFLFWLFESAIQEHDDK